jgi:archaellum component FlaC
MPEEVDVNKIRKSLRKYESYYRNGVGKEFEGLNNKIEKLAKTIEELEETIEELRKK